MPRLGTRKLHYLLHDELKELHIGRDRLFRILRANHLLINPKRSYHVTTNSHHHFRKHRNKVGNLAIVRPEQVWVADITYLGKRDQPCYLALITDAYSKMIVGYSVSEHLDTANCTSALLMAAKQRVYKTEPLIHHSDRGIQYCSNEYQETLDRQRIDCSMTESYDPYQNAVAERVNGILKQEFMIDCYNEPVPVIRQIVKESIDIYNHGRPHFSCHLKTPAQMHQQNTLIMKTYKRIRQPT
jgi:transposase InsO family protein